jgi:hypothetical protein
MRIDGWRFTTMPAQRLGSKSCTASRPIASHAAMVEGSMTVYARHAGGRGVSQSVLKYRDFSALPF